MKKYLIAIIVCTQVLLSSTCKKKSECHNTISFDNKSNKEFYVVGNTKYPDTDYYRYDVPNPTLSPINHKVYANQNNTSVLRLSTCYEYVLKNTESDTIMVFIFDAQVLESTPWDTVKVNNLYLKRCDLSLQDLKNKDFKLTYP